MTAWYADVPRPFNTITAIQAPVPWNDPRPTPAAKHKIVVARNTNLRPMMFATGIHQMLTSPWCFQSVSSSASQRTLHATYKEEVVQGAAAVHVCQGDTGVVTDGCPGRYMSSLGWL